MLNNPLLYVDPSGEFAEVGVAVIIGWIVFAVAAAVGAYALYKNYLDSSTYASTTQLATPGSNLNNTQGIASGIKSPSENSKPNIPSGIKKVVYWSLESQIGSTAGFIAGLQSTWEFAKSLTTIEGWSNVGQGLMNLAEMGSPYSAYSIKGMQLRTAVGISVENFIARIPEMSPMEMNYYVGYAVEKVAESLLVSYGTGAVVNGTRGTVVAANAAKGGMTTVGRWMSQAEYNAMKAGGRILEGAGGKTSVATGGFNSFKGAAKGSVYAEFQVPTNSLIQGGQSN